MNHGFVIKNNDLLFEIYFSAISTHDNRYYSTQVVHSAILPSMGKLHYVCGTKALKTCGFDTDPCYVADIIMTPPELLPYIDESSRCNYTINEHITADDWELVDNIPVENPLPAMRKFHEDGEKSDRCH